MINFYMKMINMCMKVMNVSYEKDLGICLDNQFKFSNQIESAARKAISNLSMYQSTYLSS